MPFIIYKSRFVALLLSTAVDVCMAYAFRRFNHHICIGLCIFVVSELTGHSGLLINLDLQLVSEISLLKYVYNGQGTDKRPLDILSASQKPSAIFSVFEHM